MFETIIVVDGKEFVVGTHDRAHLDEVGAILFVDKCATNKWVAENINEGRLLLGVGGGKFDDHSDSLNEKEKRATSTCRLVAESLGVADNPEIAHIVNYINMCDNTKPGDLPTLANVFWKMQRVADAVGEEVGINWAIQGLEIMFDETEENFDIDFIREVGIKNGYDPADLDAWLALGKQALENDQVLFLEAVEEYKKLLAEKKIRFAEIKIRGKVKKVLGVISDNANIGKALRSGKFGGGASATVIANSQGNYHIMIGDKLGVSLDEVVAIIRMMEQQKSKLVTRDWNELRKSGEVAGAENWFYFQQARQLYNGSLTHADKMPTLLSFEEVFEAVELGLNKEKFHEKCDKAKCFKKCPYNAFGLDRCRLLRRHQYPVK